MRLSLLAVIGVVFSVSGSPSHAFQSETLEASLTNLESALQDVRQRAAVEPGLVQPMQVEALAADIATIRENSGEVPPEEAALLATALDEDAALLRQGAEARDLNVTWQSLNTAMRSLDMVGDASESASRDGIQVEVAVFTVQNGTRVPGYTVSAHRVGNPNRRHPFNRLTSVASPTSNRRLVPGVYRFIATRSGAHAAYVDEVPAHRSEFIVEVPVE